MRKYVLETVKINQDSSLDPNDVVNKSTANRDTDFPWPDHPLPSFFDSLPPHSQELLRRARQGDLDVKPCVWDKQRQEWVRADKAKSRGLGGDVLKSRHLMNVDLDQDADDADDDDAEDDSADEDIGMTGLPTNGNTAAVKKRKLATGLEERTIEVKKWVQVPLDKADKMPEPKYLADRRPGMGSLYTPAYLKSVTAYGAPVDGVSGQAATFDLGDGGGLGNAMGGAGVVASGEATPVRRNMPPKRKKKKLGGPGRRKAVPVEAVPLPGESAAVEVKDGDGAVKTISDGSEEVKKEAAGEEGVEDGEEASGDESEGEGSEEGEVNDEIAAVDPSAIDPAPTLTPTPVPEVNVEEVKEAIEGDMEEGAAAAITQAAVEEVDEVEKEEPVDLLGSVEAAMEEEKTD